MLRAHLTFGGRVPINIRTRTDSVGWTFRVQLLQDHLPHLAPWHQVGLRAGDAAESDSKLHGLGLKWLHGDDKVIQLAFIHAPTKISALVDTKRIWV